jgi:hypothetical protein
MSASRERLLQPTLGSDAPPVAAPYSVQATFFTGFFGGPFAAIALIAINTWRLRRLGRDWAVLAACLIATIFVIWALHGAAPTFAPMRDWLTSTLGPTSHRYAHRFAALVLVGAGYLLHRKEQRNTDLMGLTRPNGWIAGGACAVIGGVLLAAVAAAMADGSR